jgi:DNA-binding PadR family transcriptional regulator
MAKSAARRGRVYELFVLGELVAGPHHGYLLHAILGRILGPFRHVSWGALYPLIHRLEREGLIAAAASREGGRGRILYRIRPAGRRRFLELMLEKVPYGAYEPDLFLSKLGYFDHITAEQQAGILRYHLDYLQAQDEFIQAGLLYALAEKEIPEAERARIKWLTDFRLRRLQSEIEWVQNALANTR